MTDEHEGIEAGAPFEGLPTIGEPEIHVLPPETEPTLTPIGKRFTVSEIEAILRPAFGMAEAVNGGRVVKADLTASEDELHDIAVPLTAIVNRNDQLRKLAEKGDGIALIMAFGRYGFRVGGDHVYHTQLEANEAALAAPENPDPFGRVA